MSKSYINRRLFISCLTTVCGLTLFSPSSEALAPVILVAGFVVTELAKGALNYVGGKLMANALGDVQLTDVRAWIQDAVRELEVFVSAELRSQLTTLVLNEMYSDLSGVKTEIDQYSQLTGHNLQLANRYLLEGSDSKTATLSSLSYLYDQAFFISIGAMSYRLITLDALYELDKSVDTAGSSGHIDSARPLIDEFVTTLMAMRNRIAGSMDPSKRIIFQSGGCGGIIADSGGLEFVKIDLQDGMLLFAKNGNPPCQATVDSQPISMHGTIDQKRDIYNSYKNAFMKDQQSFLSLSAAGISTVVKTYQVMSQKIGKSYTPPIDIAVPAYSDLAFSGKTLRMRGATVKVR